MTEPFKLLSSVKCFGGYQNRYSHESKVTKCTMTFSVYLPKESNNTKVPCLWYLSGLTCTDENFVIKAGAQREAAKYGFIIVSPDTSPRGCNIPGDSDSWDFGVGAGFYVDATEPKWAEHYKMYSYINKELFELIQEHFPVLKDKQSIFGHSMGGHGALISALKNPNRFRSVSCFSPISNPTQCAWGMKAFSGYLGDSHHDLWQEYDATHLVSSISSSSWKEPLHILIDQGTEDKFYKEKQLLPENFVSAVEKIGQQQQQQQQVHVNLRLQEGYDHSYYFIASFIPDHFSHHAKFLL